MFDDFLYEPLYEPLEVAGRMAIAYPMWAGGEVYHALAEADDGSVSLLCGGECHEDTWTVALNPGHRRLCARCERKMGHVGWFPAPEDVA